MFVRSNKPGNLFVQLSQFIGEAVDYLLSNRNPRCQTNIVQLDPRMPKRELQYQQLISQSLQAIHLEDWPAAQAQSSHPIEQLPQFTLSQRAMDKARVQFMLHFGRQKHLDSQLEVRGYHMAELVV